MPNDHLISRFSHSLGATGLRWTGRLNVPIYRATGGRLGSKVGKAPVLLLTTTGRKSGEKRVAPLVYLADGERWAVIDTNAGNARIPAWSRNLDSDPLAAVEIGKRRTPVRARLTSGEERADLWRRHNEQYAGFDDYDEVLEREPKVWILEPSAGPRDGG